MSDKDQQIESGDVDPEVVKYERKTDEQIAEIAKGIYKNEIFPSWYIRPNDAHLVTSIFMPLIFVDSVTQKQWQIDGIDHFYANMSEAGPRSINGYPMFMSLSILTLEDASRIHAKVQEIKKLLGD